MSCLSNRTAMVDLLVQLLCFRQSKKLIQTSVLTYYWCVKVHVLTPTRILSSDGGHLELRL